MTHSLTGQSEATEPDEVPVGSSLALGEGGGAENPRYVVIAEIGRGAMGRVLRAYDPRLQREVALKLVGGEDLGRKHADRLVAEAHALAKVSHPNVVPVFDVERSAETVVLVMEFVRGRDLEDWLQDETPSWRRIVQTFCEAGRGLAAAHAAGILHRDFKPANVLVSEDGAVKVADFGLAKGTSIATVDPEGSAVSGVGDVRLTQVGSTVGTPLYMAPEQHTDAELTPAADQFAFCVALYRALTGESPFDPDRLVRSKLQAERSWPTTAVPGFVKRVVNRGMQPKPEDRWPSMVTLLAALDPAQAEKGRRGYRSLAVLAVVGVGSAAAAAWISDSEPPCRGAERQLVSTWDDDRREVVRDALLGLDSPLAGPAWERAEQELDHHAEAWVRMHVDACEATSVRREQSPELLDLRMRCLRRARVEMRTIVDQLAQADEEVVVEAHRLLDGLRPLSTCADEASLVNEIAPPLPAEVEAVESIR